MFKNCREGEGERERDHHDPVAPVKINVTHHLKISFLLSFFFKELKFTETGQRQ